MPPRKRRRKNPTPITDRLSAYRRIPHSVARAKAPPSMDVLSDAWPRIAGDLARDSVPIRCSRAGIVTIACRDAARAQQITFRSDGLADALERATGTVVRGLRCTVADHAIPTFVPASRPQPVKAGSAARRAADGIVASIEDTRLREVVQRAAALSIQHSWNQK